VVDVPVCLNHNMLMCVCVCLSVCVGMCARQMVRDDCIALSSTAVGGDSGHTPLHQVKLRHVHTLTWRKQTHPGPLIIGFLCEVESRNMDIPEAYFELACTC